MNRTEVEYMHFIEKLGPKWNTQRDEYDRNCGDDEDFSQVVEFKLVVDDHHQWRSEHEVAKTEDELTSHIFRVLWIATKRR